MKNEKKATKKRSPKATEETSKKRHTTTKTTGRKSTSKGGTKTTSKPKKIENKAPVKKKSTVRSGNSKRKVVKKKNFHWSDTEYTWFYLSIFGYVLFIGEVGIYWFLTEEWQSFFELFFKNLIREPYVPTIIGGMFLLPLHTYLKGMDYPLKKITLVGFFFIMRNIAYVTFLAMV